MPASVYLVFPPMWSPRQPYLSLPALTAYLKAAGVSVTQRDLNIEAYNHFLRGDYVEHAFARIRERIKQFETRPSLSASGMNEYVRLAWSATSAPYVARHLDRANRIMRDPEDFFDPEKFSWATKCADEALRIISTAYFPAIFNFSTLQFKYPSSNVTAVRQAIRDREHNLLIPFFEEHVVPDLCRERPDLLGISICSPEQLIPAVTLAHLTKRAMPELPIYAGGGYYTSIYEGKARLGREHFFLDLFDGIVIHEGEIPLLEICDAVASGNEEKLKRIPNLIREENGSAIIPEEFCCEQIDSLPAPDFSGFPLDAYFAPEPVLPLLTCRGCYWQRCAFCSSCDIHHSGFRQRSVERVVADIRSLQERYGVSRIFFADLAITPAFLKGLADALIRENIKIHWACEGRFERQYTYTFLQMLRQAGCVKILFGLESGNQRVLDLMDKGYGLESVSHVLDACMNAQIAVHLYLIVGFPTETRQEAEDTLHFLLKRERLLNSPGFSFVFSNFGLAPRSRVNRDPARYGISDVHTPPGTELAIMMAYRQDKPGALGEAEIRELLGEFSARIAESIGENGYPRSMIDDILYLARYGWQPGGLQSRAPGEDLSVSPDTTLAIDEHLTVSSFREFVPSGEEDDDTPWLAGGEVNYFYHGKRGSFGELDADTYRLLRLCDGAGTAAEICRAYAGAGENRELSLRATELLERLHQARLICRARDSGADEA